MASDLTLSTGPVKIPEFPSSFEHIRQFTPDAKSQWCGGVLLHIALQEVEVSTVAAVFCRTVACGMKMAVEAVSTSQT